MNLNALRDEPASQPEPRPTGFVDGDYPLDLMARSCSARSIAGKRSEQGFLRGLDGALRLHLRQARHLRRQNPTLATQLYRKNKRAIVIGRSVWKNSGWLRHDQTSLKNGGTAYQGLATFMGSVRAVIDRWP
jgi:hypothetical protein